MPEYTDRLMTKRIDHCSYQCQYYGSCLVGEVCKYTDPPMALPDNHNVVIPTWCHWPKAEGVRSGYQN